MTMRAKVKIENLDKPVLTDDEKRLLLKKIAEYGIRAIHRRIDKGEDINGVPFKMYDPKYEKYRIEKRSRTNYGPGDWLVLSGQMMKSMAISELTEKHFIVECLGARSDNDRSNADIAEYNDRIRKFAGLNKKEKSRAISAGKRAIKKKRQT